MSSKIWGLFGGVGEPIKAHHPLVDVHVHARPLSPGCPWKEVWGRTSLSSARRGEEITYPDGDRVASRMYMIVMKETVESDRL